MSKRVVRSTLAPSRSTERRDPVAATQQLQFLGLGIPQTNRHDAARTTRRSLQAWVVMRCIQIKAQDLAGLPFVAGPRLPASYLELPQTNPSSRMGQLLGVAPAPALSSGVWWEWMLTQRYLTGQMASELDVNGEEIAALWPLTSSALKAIPTKGGAAWWAGFEYGRADQPKRLPPDRVFYGWDPSPDDFRQPWSILASAAIDVDVAVMVGRYNAAFLRNDARPAQVVVTESFATQEDYDQFVAQFEGRHMGPENAGRSMFVETDPDGALPNQAVHIQTLGLSQKDARILEQERAALEHVAMALGVPWSRLSAADRTFSNAGQESVDYWQGLAKDARKFGGEVNAQLADRLGGEVGWFDLSDVDALKVRPPVTAQEASTLVLGGIASPEEVRPWFGLAAELPAGLVVAGPDPAPVPSRSLPEPVPAPEPERRDPPALPAAAPVPETRALTAEQQEQRRTTIWRRNNATLTGLEHAYAKRWAAYFARQSVVVVDQVKAKRTAVRLAAAASARELRADVPLGGPLDPNEIARWRTQALDLADLMHTAAATAGVTRVNNAFGVSFDLEAPFIQDFILARANQLAGQVTDTTYAAVQQALADGVAAGASIDDLAEAVRRVFTVASESRSVTIARTEVISAANGSASLAAAQLPADVAAGQEWISTRDERTRDDHADADGQIVAMGTPFDVGGESLLYPGDPAGDSGNVINCRCYPADTLVQAPGVRAGFRRWYEGDLVEITTAGGHQFAGTPNHPVLTGAGWRPLHSLVEGDRIISGRVRDDSAGRPDVVDVPTPIGEVVDALALVAATVGTVERVLSSGMDFHGDGQDGPVDVVAPGRELGNRVQAAGAQHGVQHVLAVGLEGEMHVPHEQANLGVGHRVDAKLLSGRPASAPDALGSQAGGDDLAAGAVLVGQSLLADAGPVQGGDLGGVDAVVGAPLGDGGGLRVTDWAHEAALLEFAAQSGRADVMGASGHEHVGPFEVGVDRVLDVRVRRFAGHVFNLSTETGTYIAEGIVTHNCTVAFLTPKDMERAGRSRRVPLRSARALVRMVPTGEFDEAQFRAALEAA